MNYRMNSSRINKNNGNGVPWVHDGGWLLGRIREALQCFIM